MSTLRISNIEAKSVPASATIDEKVKITNSSGDPLVFIDGKTSGITTVGINTTDGNIKFDENSNIVVTGIITATRFSGQITPTSLEIGSNIKLGNAGVITATSFVGSGANLTNLPTQVTITGNADNRIITGGSGVNLTGESNFTYDGGGNLTLNSTVHDGGFNILAANDNQETRLRLQGKASDGTGHSFYINAKRSSNRLDIGTASGAAISVTSTLNVGIQNVGPESPLQIGTGTNAVTNKSTVHVAPASGNASLTLRGGSPTIYFDGTGGGHTRLLTDNTDIAISNGNPDNTGNERFRLASSGNLTISDGNLVVANGHGIDFSATSDATGSSSELLDDYEEGSWTPAAKNAGSFTSPTGRYVKIGQQVTVWGYIPLVTNITSSSNFEISGLPYTATSTAHTEFVGPCMIRWINSTSATGVSFSTYQASGWNYLRIYASRDDGNNYEAVKHSDFAFDSPGIRFCHSYTV